MAILICRVAWMKSYQSEEERAYGGGSYVDEGNVPHEALNFLRVGDTYYGFVENRRQQIKLERLGGQKENSSINGVLVVFCAKDRETDNFLVTGWYTDATVHRHAIARPGNPLGRHVHFTATDAKLIGESKRCFRIPRAQDNPPSSFGGIGQRHIWYGLNDESAVDFRESLNGYMADQALMQTPEKAVVESRKRCISERLEKRGTSRQFIKRKGYWCEACGWSIEEDEEDVWASSFELHHLTPFSELKEGGSRVVHMEDFAVLCASCHRAIHRTDCVSHIERFTKENRGRGLLRRP